MSETVAERLTRLRAEPIGNSRTASDEAAIAVEKAGELWEDRLAHGWRPPASDDAYPWEMIQPGLQALVPGLRAASKWQERAKTGSGPSKACGLILAGNTPLMSWSPLVACLLAGHSVFAKMSRTETLWPRLLRDSIAEVAPGVEKRIELDVWPGKDTRTADLIRNANAVIAFGSNATLSDLRQLTPAGVPFFGYGHGISVAIWTSTAELGSFDRWFAGLQAQGAAIARDTLMYDQSGCLSPQALFVDINDPNPHLLPLLKSILVDSFPIVADKLHVADVTDPAVATAVRNARDVASFGEADVYGEDDLNWTVLAYPKTIVLTDCVGKVVLTLVPFQDWSILPTLFGKYRGQISSIGVAGTLPAEQTALFEAEGVNRICEVGEMQMPPLDWPNGGFDLLKALNGI